MKKKKNKKKPKPKVANKISGNETADKKVRIKIVGIGGGGGNIIAELLKKLKDFSNQKVEFVAVNTDSQALKSLPKALKTFSFGQKTTKGLGTGRDVAIGEKAAKEDIEKIKGIFSDNKDLYIIISSLGGGTGTGATPIFTHIAEEMGLVTLGIFTLPFAFEGRKKMDASLKAIERMKDDVNAYMVLPNEKIFSLTKEEISFADSLNLLNDRLADSLEGLLRTIYAPGLINIDWADIKTILEDKKRLAYINFIKSKTTASVDDIAKELLRNPILDYYFEDADNVMFNIEGSKDLSLAMLSQISKKISELAPNAKIIFGLSQNAKSKSELKITILSTSSEERKKKHRAIMKRKKYGRIMNKNMDAKIGQKKGEAPEVRRSALEIKEAEKKEQEKEEEEEKIFEIPAFLRKAKKEKK